MPGGPWRADARDPEPVTTLARTTRVPGWETLRRQEGNSDVPFTGTTPALFVILGATGDLTRRKLFPALARLVSRGLVGDRFLVLGAARSADMTDESFRALDFMSDPTGAARGAACRCHPCTDQPASRAVG